MPGIVDVVGRTRSGVANLVLERDRTRVASGSGFLIQEGLVTAAHVLDSTGYDTVRIRFDDHEPDEGIRMDRAHIQENVIFHSGEDDRDVVVVEIDEPEVNRHHRFSITTGAHVPIGTQALIMGYPYETSWLTCHVAYVSALFEKGRTSVLQLDGSVNPSNSGGPVLDAESGDVLGYITRARTGLTDDFDELRRTLRENVRALAQPAGSRIVIGGLDPRQALLATMNSMSRLAENMRHSANVGIGYAFAAQPLTEIQAT